MSDLNESKGVPFDGSKYLADFETNAQNIFNDDIDLSGCEDYKVINLDFTDFVEKEERYSEERMKELRRNCVFTAIVGGLIFGLAYWKTKG